MYIGLVKIIKPNGQEDKFTVRPKGGGFFKTYKQAITASRRIAHIRLHTRTYPIGSHSFVKAEKVMGHGHVGKGNFEFFTTGKKPKSLLDSVHVPRYF